MRQNREPEPGAGTGVESPDRPRLNRAISGYLGLIRAEIRTSPDRDADHKVQADNIKRWGSISRPPPESLGMSGWERLSAEGR